MLMRCAASSSMFVWIGAVMSELAFSNNEVNSVAGGCDGLKLMMWNKARPATAQTQSTVFDVYTQLLDSNVDAEITIRRGKNGIYRASSVEKGSGQQVQEGNEQSRGFLSSLNDAIEAKMEDWKAKVGIDKAARKRAREEQGEANQRRLKTFHAKKGRTVTASTVHEPELAAAEFGSELAAGEPELEAGEPELEAVIQKNALGTSSDLAQPRVSEPELAAGEPELETVIQKNAVGTSSDLAQPRVSEPELEAGEPELEAVIQKNAVGTSSDLAQPPVSSIIAPGSSTRSANAMRSRRSESEMAKDKARKAAKSAEESNRQKRLLREQQDRKQKSEKFVRMNEQLKEQLAAVAEQKQKQVVQDQEQFEQLMQKLEDLQERFDIPKKNKSPSHSRVSVKELLSNRFRRGRKENVSGSGQYVMPLGRSSKAKNADEYETISESSTVSGGVSVGGEVEAGPTEYETEHAGRYGGSTGGKKRQFIRM